MVGIEQFCFPILKDDSWIQAETIVFAYSRWICYRSFQSGFPFAVEPIIFA